MHMRRAAAAVRHRASGPVPALAPIAAARLTIAVVTEDAALGEALRRATPDRTVMIIATPLALADLLLQESTAVLVVDCAALGSSSVLLVDRLAEQFPELSLIAVGSRDDEAALSAQLSAGHVHRFLHRPVSIERARTFVDAALRRQAGLQSAHRRAAVPPASPASWAAALALVALLVLLLARLLWPPVAPPLAIATRPVKVSPASRPTATTAATAGAVPRPAQAALAAATEPAAAARPTVADAPAEALAERQTPALETPPPVLAYTPDVLAQPPVTVDVEAAPPRRLAAPAPEYPLAARRNGVEGWVALAVTVAADGSVAGATVTAAEPRGTFEAAALAAVQRFRYSDTGAPAEVHERLLFRLR